MTALDRRMGALRPAGASSAGVCGREVDATQTTHGGEAAHLDAGCPMA